MKPSKQQINALLDRIGSRGGLISQEDMDLIAKWSSFMHQTNPNEFDEIRFEEDKAHDKPA